MAAPVFDAATELFFSPSTNPRTFTHTPFGTPKGVLLFLIVDESTTDPWTGAVTYGGVAMTAVPGARAVASVTELGSCKAYFLGSSVPSGAQTVSITHNSALAENRYAVCITVTAAADTAISGTPVLLEGTGTLAEQNVDTGSDLALRFAAVYSGNPDPSAPGANSTAVHDLDIGSRAISVVRETVAGSGSRPVGFSVGGAPESRAAVHLAIAESSGGGGVSLARSYARIIG